MSHGKAIDADARDRAWLWAAAIVVALAAVSRIHNAFVFPPLQDFDAPGHALNVFSLYEGHLPSRRSWSGFHPPLYYALGAAFWRVLPEEVPIHAALRLLSAAAGFGAVAIAWRVLLRFVPRVDAAIVAALALCAPVLAIATSMFGNETTCAFFATATLARLCALPDDPARVVRHAGPTALLAALAALSKSTGLLLVGVVGVAYLWRLRGAGRFVTRALVAVGAVSLALLGPYYGRMLVEAGSPRAMIGGGALSDEAGNEMAAQPPGERHLVDYVLLPPAMFAAPVKDAPEMVRSVPGLLYASVWADGQGQFLPAELPAVLTRAAFGALFGLLPTVLLGMGIAHIVRTRQTVAAAGVAYAYAGLLLSAFLVQTWIVPVYSAVKASYLLSALLPVLLALAVGLASTTGRGRTALRAALLLLAVYDLGLTWYGWWA